jgi:signal peptidase I
MAGLTAVSAVLGPIIALPLALIPLLAGIGIWRGRVWSAYGLALYFFAEILVACLAIFRAGGVASAPPGLIASAAVALLLGAFFVLAGRSLAGAGAARGRALPWILVAAICSLPSIFVQPFVIPSAAMENTLLVGDRIFVQRLPRPNPSRGDIIVFRYPLNVKEDYVKRAIGLPGDHIRLVNKQLVLNGRAVEEPYVKHVTSYVDAYRDNFPSAPNISLPAPAMDMLEKHVVNGEVVVPPDCVFAMDDNRDDSADSRYWGFVPLENIEGKPLVIYASVEAPGKIRWGRTFRIVHGYGEKRR